MLSTLLSIIAFIFALSILTAIHEFGHFWVARRCGVKVERFSIGFGKALWKRYDRQGTEYVIALIPLGGYVKMLDERAATVPPELRDQAFNRKTVLQRSAIIAAGPTANFIFAIFAYWLVFMYGVPGIRPVVGEIVSGSIAHRAEITANMELKAIGGIETPDWEAVRMALVSKLGEREVTVSLVAPESSQRFEKKLDLQGWQFEPSKQDPLMSIGIATWKALPVLAKVQAKSPASNAGLQAGDRIAKVNGQSLTGWQDFVAEVRQHPGKAMVLEIERGQERVSVTLTPAKRTQGNSEGYIGVVPRIAPLSEQHRILKQYGPFSAIAEATQKTWQLTKLTITMTGKLITGDINLNNLSGPIAIAQGAGASAGYGLIYYLIFLALISVNLGVINLFPLPVLDGGHLLFLLVEKIKGKPVPEQVQDFSYRIGAVLLVLLMGVALFNDFSRL